MERAAVEKANNRLQRAKASLERVAHSVSYEEFESAWADLLIALNTVHCALEQGAKMKPQSRQWYGGKKKIRNKDPLLNYLHQARNADEHGIEPISKHEPSSLGIRSAGGDLVLVNPKINGDGDIVSLESRGDPIIVEALPSYAVLVTVWDRRFNTKFDPPTSHLGAPLKDCLPLTIGKLGVDYHEAIIKEAEALIT